MVNPIPIVIKGDDRMNKTKKHLTLLVQHRHEHQVSECDHPRNHLRGAAQLRRSRTGQRT
jgi:hypothetical protein